MKIFVLLYALVTPELININCTVYTICMYVLQQNIILFEVKCTMFHPMYKTYSDFRPNCYDHQPGCRAMN